MNFAIWIALINIALGVAILVFPTFLRFLVGAYFIINGLFVLFSIS